MSSSQEGAGGGDGTDEDAAFENETLSQRVDGLIDQLEAHFRDEAHNGSRLSQLEVRMVTVEMQAARVPAVELRASQLERAMLELQVDWRKAERLAAAHRARVEKMLAQLIKLATPVQGATNPVVLPAVALDATLLRPPLPSPDPRPLPPLPRPTPEMDLDAPVTTDTPPPFREGEKP